MKTLIVGLIFGFSILTIPSMARAQVSPGFQSNSFQYLAGVLTPSQAATTRAVTAWNSEFPPKFYSMSVTTTASGFVVALQGSLDGSNWSQIAVTSSAAGVVSNVAPIPALYLRMIAQTIAANTAITATAIGVP